MRPPGLARDWMREQEVEAGPVRTLSKGSAACRHWPLALERTVLLAASDADANRASRNRGIEAGPARRQMRAPRTRPARDSPGMAAVGMAVAACRNMLC